MDLSQQSYDSKSLVDATEEGEVLNLTGDLVPLPECSAEFGRIMIDALEEWEGLLAGGQFPSANAIDELSEKLLGPASFLFDVSQDPARPSVVYTGPRIPFSLELTDSSDGDELGSDGSFHEQFTELCVRAVSSREPFDFNLDRLDDDHGRWHGLMLPFSNDGEAIDHVLCILDVLEPAAELLTAEDDGPATGELLLEQEAEPTLDELLLEQEFEPEEMPNLAPSNEPEDAEPYLMISVEDQSATRRPTSWEETKYSFAPLPQAVGELVIASPTLGLVDHLVAARGMAEAASVSQARSRRALYRAIGSAYDFALAAAASPTDFAEIIEKAGLKMQERAPMTPVVKLVFGSDYDKGRLAEYATALTHAYRLGLTSGSLEDYLLAAPGGLKEIVRTERAWRRSASGNTEQKINLPHESLARKLRALPTRSFSELPPEGDEFVLVLARRDGSAGISLIGEVPHDIAMLERAARKLIAERG